VKDEEIIGLKRQRGNLIRKLAAAVRLICRASEGQDVAGD
jgi:hypothetical protein